ncbi:isochorismatase family cysteine hydrolase [Haladaptatus sp. DJG-WS-42]|uniref:cysteine hydrolase family protein n=1 Tax=Haladaptatus sp. DJG-WS-42 TaxID=3120516 RepID=UPI0030D00D1D
MELDPATTAVVVVDMQNGFCHPDGSLYAPGSEAVVDDVTTLVTQAREAGATIVYTRDVHPPAQFADAHYYDEFERWGEHVVEGTWETEFVAELDVRDEDHIVEKHTYDAFYQTELEGFLSAHGITDLLICGTLANVCVLHTASSAALRDFRPLIVREAVGAIEDGHKQYALDHAAWLFGDVLSQAEVAFTQD